MIAITVSTNYDDILNIIISQNYKFFKKWYIITDKNDSNTINVINKHNLPNIEILFFDFYQGNKTFNKGGAIRFCQKMLGNSGYEGNVLLLDSDIWLPDNFEEIIKSNDIKYGVIYGTDKRYDYYSYKNFKDNKIDLDYPYSKDFQGYFQLYKFSKDKLYNESYNCAGCDLSFINYFRNKVILPNLTVSHLGKNTVNWNKRLNKNDFIID